MEVRWKGPETLKASLSEAIAPSSYEGRISQVKTTKSISIDALFLANANTFIVNASCVN